MGMVGVGAVLIVPAAIAILDVNAKTAVASAIMAYVITSTVGIYSYRETLTRFASFAAILTVGSTIGGFVAAFVLSSLQDGEVAIAIATFSIFFGFKSLVEGMIQYFKSDRSTEETFKETPSASEGFCLPIFACNEGGDSEAESNIEDVEAKSACFDIDTEVTTFYYGGGVPTKMRLSSLFLGIFVGFGSAISGSSGSLVFIPTMLLVHPETSAPTAVALAMIIGIPLAISMTVGNMVNNQTIDTGISLIIGITACTFIPVGARASMILREWCGDASGNRIVLILVSLVLMGTGAFVLSTVI